VNRHQQIALENHCRLAGETINPLFGYVVLNAYSICLTVNSGYE
jgi:hypothetical protein